MTIPRVLDDLATWSATTSGSEVVVHLLGWLVAGTASYLLVVTTAYALAVARRSPRGVARAGAMLPPRLRRFAERTVAACLVTTTWAAPGIAVTGPDGPIPPGLAVPRSAGPTSGPGDGRLVTVASGDHLWSIATSALAAARGTTPGELPAGDVVAYWRDVVERNRPHLRSGDPDLVHPGETVRLPAPPVRD